MKKISFLLALLVIAGCGDNDNINIVKKMIPDIDRTNTIGGILDNKELCSKVEWKQFTDTKDRPIVEYKCFLDLKSEIGSANTNYWDGKIKWNEKAIDNIEKEIKDIELDLKEREESIAYMNSLYQNYKTSKVINDIKNTGRTLESICDELGKYMITSKYTCRYSESIASDFYRKLTSGEINRRELADTDFVKAYVPLLNNTIATIKDSRPKDGSTGRYVDRGTVLELFYKMTDSTKTEDNIIDWIRGKFISHYYTDTPNVFDAYPERIENLKRNIAQHLISIKDAESAQLVEYVEIAQWSVVDKNYPILFNHSVCITTIKTGYKKSLLKNMEDARWLYSISPRIDLYARYLENVLSDSSDKDLVSSCGN